MKEKKKKRRKRQTRNIGNNDTQDIDEIGDDLGAHSEPDAKEDHSHRDTQHRDESNEPLDLSINNINNVIMIISSSFYLPLESGFSRF